VHSLTISKNLEEFSGGLVRNSDTDAIVEHLVPFVTAGIQAPAVAKGGKK
jgi:hypothetical protein